MDCDHNSKECKKYLEVELNIIWQYQEILCCAKASLNSDDWYKNKKIEDLENTLMLSISWTIPIFKINVLIQNRQTAAHLFFVGEDLTVKDVRHLHLVKKTS